MKPFRALLIVVCLATLACKPDPAKSVKIIARPNQPASAITMPSQASKPMGNSARRVAPQPPPAAIAMPSQASQPIGNSARRVAPPLPPANAIAMPSQASQPIVSAAKITTPPPPPQPNGLMEFCPPPAEDSLGPSTVIVNGPCAFQHHGAFSCQDLVDDFYAALTRKAKNGATLVIYLNVENYHGHGGTYEGGQLFLAVQKGTVIHRWSSDTVSATVSPDESFVTLPTTRLELEPTLTDCSILIGPASNYLFQCSGLGNPKEAIPDPDEVISGKLQCAGKE